MNVTVFPSKLSGTVNIPSSKSFSHRYLIAAALADGVSRITNVTDSVDISATVSALEAMGAEITVNGSEYIVRGISQAKRSAVIDCCESGSTLRFLIPVASALGISAEFIGRGKLPERPITPYIREMSKKGVAFDYNSTMPFKTSGTLCAGEYLLEGDVSSQFITGLLFALPLCSGDSVIKLMSRLESKPYADMTVAVLKEFGVNIREANIDGQLIYLIRGNQSYKPTNGAVEGDFSQAAFFFTANALGSDIEITNLNKNSVQGDKKILEILSEIGYNRRSKTEKERNGQLRPFTADAADIPDLVPILTVLGCFTSGKSEIVNAKRLKIKESDRLAAIADALNVIGGKVTDFDDRLEIMPVDGFAGGTVSGCNDHRIVMSAAIAATASSAPVTIIGAEAVNKSYPKFFEDFKALGGRAEFSE